MTKLVNRKSVDVNINSPREGHVPIFDEISRLWNTVNLVDTIVNNRDNFPYTGSAVISGSLQIIGSFDSDRDIIVGGIPLGTGGGGFSTNVAIGDDALSSNQTGQFNVAIGDSALENNINGFRNVALGPGALLSNVSGFRNTAIGNFSLALNTTGFRNTALGNLSLFNNTTGINNVGIGDQAGSGITTGDYNVVLGSYSAAPYGTQSNNIFISDGQGNLRLLITGSDGTSYFLGDVSPFTDNLYSLGSPNNSWKSLYAYEIYAVTASAQLFSGSLLGTASLAENSLLLQGTASATFATTGSNTFIGNQAISGGLVVDGQINLTGNQLVSGSISVIGTTQFIGDVNASGSILLDGNQIVSGSLLVFGESEIIGDQVISGSLKLNGPSIISGSLEITEEIFGNLIGTASYASLAENSLLLNETGSDVFATTGSNQFIGNQDIIGNLNLSGSFNSEGNVFITGGLEVIEDIVGNLNGTASFALTSSYIDGGFY
jgi:hypothetical protein